MHEHRCTEDPCPAEGTDEHETDERPTPDEIREAATDAGTEAGTAQASWLLFGRSTEADARAILEASDNCEIDYPAPLSGEHAGQSIPEIIHDAGLDYEALNTDEMHDYNDVDIFLDAYEEAFFAAYEAEAVRSAQAILNP